MCADIPPIPLTVPCTELIAMMPPSKEGFIPKSPVVVATPEISPVSLPEARSVPIEVARPDTAPDTEPPPEILPAVMELPNDKPLIEP